MGYSRTRAPLKPKHRSTVLPVPKLSLVLVCILVRLTGIEDSQDLRDSHFSTDAKLHTDHRQYVELEVPL